jgi:transmembrane sensor
MNPAEDPLAQGEASVRAWLVRLRSGEATTEDRQAFERWCEAHPEQARFVPVMGQIWGKLGVAANEVASELAAGVATGLAAETTTMKSPADRARAAQRARAAAWKPGRRAFVGFAVAAGASWLALRPPLQLWPALSDLSADYRTGTGEQRRLALSERVVIEMNTQTRINLLSAQSTQHGIELLAGEADVVAAMPSTARLEPIRPLVVVAGRGRLQANLARFDVRRVDDQVCVTCVSGSVAFEHPQQQLTLTAGQQLTYDDHRVRTVSQANVATVTAWRRGLIAFDGVPLAQVVEEINRYRPGKVILRNAELGKRNVHAQFFIARLDDAVNMIGELYGARVTTLPGNITLLS